MKSWGGGEKTPHNLGVKAVLSQNLPQERRSLPKPSPFFFSRKTQPLTSFLLVYHPMRIHATKPLSMLSRKRKVLPSRRLLSCRSRALSERSLQSL